MIGVLAPAAGPKVEACRLRGRPDRPVRASLKTYGKSAPNGNGRLTVAGQDVVGARSVEAPSLICRAGYLGMPGASLADVYAVASENCGAAGDLRVHKRRPLAGSAGLQQGSAEGVAGGRNGPY